MARWLEIQYKAMLLVKIATKYDCVSKAKEQANLEEEESSLVYE